MHRYLRKWLWLMTAVGLTMVVALHRAEAVRIGVLLPLSGPMAPAGEAARTGVDMAAASDGFAAPGATLHVADTAGSSEGGRTATMRLIREKQVDVLVGCLTSPAAWSAAAVAEASGVPLLISGAGSTAITEPPYRFVFRLNPPVEEKYAALASFMDRYVPASRTAAVLCEALPPAETLSEQWLAQAAALDLDPLFRVRFAPGRIDYRPELAKVRVKKPALLVLIAAPADAALMMRQRLHMPLAPKVIIGEAPGVARPEFAGTAGKAGESLCALVPWAASASFPGARRFTRAYFERYGRLPGHHEALGFAALNVVADAVSRSRPTSKGALRNAMAKTDLSTICGVVRFNAKGARPGQNRAPWLLVQWQSGRLETVWPRNRASAEPIFP